MLWQCEEIYLIPIAHKSRWAGMPLIPGMNRKWQEGPNQCPPGLATASPLFLFVNTNLFTITIWAFIFPWQGKFLGGELHKNIYFPVAWSRSVSQVRSEVMQMLQERNTGKSHSNYSISAHLHGMVFFFFFKRRKEFMISGAWARGLFRNSPHFDLITESKYSWNTMISPRGRRLAINFQIQVIY